MKLNEINKLLLLYFVLFLIIAIVGQVLFYFLFTDKFLVLNIAASVFLCIIAVIILRFLLHEKYNYFKKIEKENYLLKQASEKHEIILKATRDTIWDWNIKEKTFILSKGIEEMFGYTTQEVENNLEWWFSKIHLEDSLKISVYINATTNESEERWQDEYRFRCADGSYKHIFDRGFVVKDKNNNVTRMIGVMQDVTKQKTEEIRLRLLETAITHTKDSILISESNATINGIPKIVYANEAFTKITGFEQSEIIGENPSLFLSKSSISNYLNQINNALKKKTDLTFIGLNQRKDGETYWIHFTMIPISDNNNKHSHWIAIQRDITQEKEREEEREQLITELIQNNKDLRQFSYITSHNLRAPLSNLIGLLNLIEEIPFNNQELDELFDGFSKSTYQLNETINDLIKIIVIKDQITIEKENVKISYIIEKVKNQLLVLIESKKVEIILNLNEEYVYANTIYIESVLLNLMSNAIKYSKNNVNPKITITTKTEDDFTIIKFEDNGIGIDLIKNESKIFGLYQRFHNHPDSKGLGLYLVKTQVETLGGKITVESEVDEGTVFEIKLKRK
jgi:PAS domain S-box-containing protein